MIEMSQKFPGLRGKLALLRFQPENFCPKDVGTVTEIRRVAHELHRARLDQNVERGKYLDGVRYIAPA